MFDSDGGTLLMSSPPRRKSRSASLTPTKCLFPPQPVIAGFCDANSLTRREREVLEMICAGNKNIQIAWALSVSNATVRLHIGNIHRKLATRSKVDLVMRLWQWSTGTDQPRRGNGGGNSQPRGEAAHRPAPRRGGRSEADE